MTQMTQGYAPSAAGQGLPGYGAQAQPFGGQQFGGPGQQQMIPADVVSSIINLASQYGPDIIKGLSSIFGRQGQVGQAQPFAFQPQQLGQQMGQQQMVPASLIPDIVHLVSQALPYVLGGRQGQLGQAQPFGRQQWPGGQQQMMPASFLSDIGSALQVALPLILAAARSQQGQQGQLGQQQVHPSSILPWLFGQPQQGQQFQHPVFID